MFIIGLKHVVSKILIHTINIICVSLTSYVCVCVCVCVFVCGGGGVGLTGLLMLADLMSTLSGDGNEALIGVC
jgi:hypothetical protein